MRSADMTTCSALLTMGVWLGASGAAASDVPTLQNASFEQIDPNGLPTGWRLAPGDPSAIRVHGAGARQGKACVVLQSQGKELHLRQELAINGMKPVMIGGFFQADGIQAGDASYLRLYIHVLYKDRPYRLHGSKSRE